MFKKIIIVIIIIAVGSFFYWRNLNSPVDANGKEQIFIVNKGDSISEVAKNLRINNLISSEYYFKNKIGKDNIKAGEYFISPKLTTGEIIKILTLGDVVSNEKLIKIIEGWNNKDIAAYLEKNNIVSAKDFLDLANEPVNVWKFSFAKPDFIGDAPKTADLEGYLFPDTYRIFSDTTSEGIIIKMLDNFDRKLTPEIKEEIKRQGKTIYEIITMASIIEKEVRSTNDMKIVSGIFWDRIKNGRGLESCATLAYILGVNKAQYSIEDTKVDSPYNTYKYRGLSPGPIANPGFNAINAAIYPENTDYNYFLSDPATGQTIYSKTLEEHNANKYKYLK